MAQTVKDVPEETVSTTGRMNAGDTGYGGVPGGKQPSSAGESEAAPLLVPEPEPEPAQHWKPMSKPELEAAAGGPGWRKMRCYAVLLFWLVWVAVLAVSVVVIVMSPHPVAAPLKWWQKSPFYRLQPDLLTGAQTKGSGGMDAISEQLPYLRSLGIGALILEGLFDEEVFPLNLNKTSEGFGTLHQIQHLIAESNKTGLKMVLDLCELNLLGPYDLSRNTATVKHALRFWLEQGAAGFAICDTDAAYSEKTLMGWRDVLKEFSSEHEERILMVKQTGDVLPPLNTTSLNIKLVDVVMRSILPSSRHHLSVHEVAAAIKKQLQTREDDLWPSWTIGGKAPHNLKKLLLVLMMTLPGSPAVQHNYMVDHTQDPKTNSTVALFSSLSDSRVREEALLYGSFTFLPYSTSNSSSNSTVWSSSQPILAFLRSWGCVHLLVLLNVGPELHTMNSVWAPSLPEHGLFVTSTGMDRMGSVPLNTLELLPYEAVVIKFS